MAFKVDKLRGKTEAARARARDVLDLRRQRQIRGRKFSPYHWRIYEQFDYWPTAGLLVDRNSGQQHRIKATLGEVLYVKQSEQNNQVNYRAHINSPEWFATKRRLIAKRGQKCERCNLKTPFLQLYHLTHEHVAQERDWDLVLVCRRCRDSLHEAGSVDRGNPIRVQRGVSPPARRRTAGSVRESRQPRGQASNNGVIAKAQKALEAPQATLTGTR